MKPNLQEYCLDLSNYQRLPTREVSVGDVLIGAENPIKVQSMTTTDTMDTQGTIAQSIKRAIVDQCDGQKKRIPCYLKATRNLGIIGQKLQNL